MFKNSDGTRGVIGGPHEVFTKIKKIRTNISNTFNSKSFLSQQFELYRKGYHIDSDFDSINFKSSKNSDIDLDVSQEQDTFMTIKEQPIKDFLQTDSLFIRCEKAK